MAQKKLNKGQAPKPSKAKSTKDLAAHKPKPFGAVLDAFLQVPPPKK